jgi:Cellulose binding domain
MVTPTFAAGLGVVVAAALAVSMTARTVLHFSGPEGKPCAVPRCAPGTELPGSAGTLASAKPGIRLVPTPQGPKRSAQPSPSVTQGRGGEDSKQGTGSQVVIDYQTTQQWSWGFYGQIVISGLSRSSLNTWRLGFDYPGTHIVEVQGAQWQPTGDNSGVAAPEGSSDGSAWSGSSQSRQGSNGGSPTGSDQGTSGPGTGQHDVVITIEAAGTPSAPAHCRFNDTPCSFR